MKIKKFEWEEDGREWKDEWKDLRKQGDLFGNIKEPEKLIRKLPYKFYYVFEDDVGKESRMMIEDWEIGALYWHCLAVTDDESKALQKVKQKYETEFLKKKDLYFFLGTTKQWHKRAKNPFVIIGVFYPKKEAQLALF